MIFRRRGKDKTRKATNMNRDSVFVSYRRDDDPSAARSIVDRLRHEFGTQRVFFDVDTISVGANFEREIVEKLSRSRFAIVVIGPKWGRLLKDRSLDARDYVCEEIEAALRSDQTIVIPVTVGKASIPSSEELPLQISELSKIQAVEVRHTKFDSDVENDIISVIRQELDPQPRRLQTKKVKVPLTLLAGAPNNRRINREVEKQAKEGWQLAGDTFSEGLFGFGGGVTLIFQKEEDLE